MQNSLSDPPAFPGWLRGIAPACTQGFDPEVFRIARHSYDTPWRVYHDWSHIESCLALFRPQKFDQPRAVFIALLYHDAVYVPGDKDNEVRSAELAQRMLRYRSSVPQEEKIAVERMILVTANHHAERQLSGDEAKLIDIDLWILGQPWAAYEQYAQGVRREYSPAVVSPFRYCLGRQQFLSKVLAQPRIYMTDAARDRLEQAARANLAREIAMLRDEAGTLGRIAGRLIGWY